MKVLNFQLIKIFFIFLQIQFYNFNVFAFPIGKIVRVNYKLLNRNIVRNGLGILNSGNQIVTNVIKTIEPTEHQIKINRVNYKIIKKNSKRELMNQIELLIENQNQIIDNTISVMNDNCVNEFLLYLKFYHLSNDSSNTYVYIIMYEAIGTTFKILRLNMNNNKNKLDFENKDTSILFQQMIINIFVYICIKNILINKVIHHLSN